MTNITKAAQQALAALETCRIRSVTEWDVTDVTPKNVTQAIDALRAALQDKAGEVRGSSESRVCRSDFVESDQQTVLSISDAVRVCPYKDADCGDRPANWCDTCQKRHAQQPAPVVPDDVVLDAARYRLIRDGSGWPAAFASHDAPEPLRGEDLDAAMIAVSKQHATASTVATDVTVAIDHLYNERRDGMTDRIWPPVKIGTKLRAV